MAQKSDLASESERDFFAKRAKKINWSDSQVYAVAGALYVITDATKSFRDRGIALSDTISS